MVLGKQLENPYSLDNMKEALENVRLKSGTVGDFDIRTTDLYVRFLPADSMEYKAIASDTILELFDYPLDFEIEQEGNWYHDPAIPEHLPTYQYTVVKPSYQFPDTIKYEILAELFIPDEIDEQEMDTTNFKSANNSDLLEELEDEALRITGNWEEPQSTTEGSRLKSRSEWNPSGRIRVREREGGTNLRWLPVENVKVRVRRWFTIKTDYTDAKGDYRISHSFKRAVNYSVKFETPFAKISNVMGFDTRHDGPEQKSSWDVDFDWHTESWVRATLINAIVKYRVQCHRTGIQNPYPIVYWAGGEAFNKLNVRAVFKEGTGDMFPFRANSIRIYSISSIGDKETDELYAVTFHELGHQSHWKLSKWNMTWSNPIIQESWADFIQFIFTDQYYPGRADNQQWKRWNNYIWDETGGESKDEKDSWKYTALFNDLFDNANQRTQNRGRTDFPDDRVNGYTISQLQSAVEKSRNLEQVRDFVRDEYSNSTEANLDDLFIFYINVENTRKQ